MPVQVITPQRGHLYWAQMPYLPQRPLDVIQRTGKGESQVILTFKSRPVLVVQNRRDNTNPLYQFVLVAGVHSIKPGEQEKLRRINHPADILLSPGECGLEPTIGRFPQPVVHDPQESFAGSHRFAACCKIGRDQHQID